MLDFSDHSRTGISALTSAADQYKILVGQKINKGESSNEKKKKKKKYDHFVTRNWKNSGFPLESTWPTLAELEPSKSRTL